MFPQTPQKYCQRSNGADASTPQKQLFKAPSGNVVSGSWVGGGGVGYKMEWLLLEISFNVSFSPVNCQNVAAAGIFAAFSPLLAPFSTLDVTMSPLAGKGTCCLLPTATKHFDVLTGLVIPSRKYPYLPNGRLLKIPKGERILKENIKLNWNFQRGGGRLIKKPS